MEKVLLFLFHVKESGLAIDLMLAKTTENEILPLGTEYSTSTSVYPSFSGKVTNYSYSEDTNIFQTTIVSSFEIEKNDVCILKEVMIKNGWDIRLDSTY